MLAALNQQRVLRAGRIAEARVVPHQPPRGVPGSHHDIAGIADGGGEIAARLEDAADRAETSFREAGMSEERLAEMRKKFLGVK